MFRSHSLRFPLQDLFSAHSVPPASKSPSLLFVLCTLLQERQKLNSLFSNSCALFKKEYFSNFFTISNFQTLLQNTGGVRSSAARRLPTISTSAPVGHTATPANQLFSYVYSTILWIRRVGGLPHGFGSFHPFCRRPRPKAETSCQLRPSCIDSSGTARLHEPRSDRQK
jgi:hypothetical protein